MMFQIKEKDVLKIIEVLKKHEELPEVVLKLEMEILNKIRN